MRNTKQQRTTPSSYGKQMKHKKMNIASVPQADSNRLQDSKVHRKQQRRTTTTIERTTSNTAQAHAVTLHKSSALIRGTTTRQRSTHTNDKHAQAVTVDAKTIALVNGRTEDTGSENELWAKPTMTL